MGSKISVILDDDDPRRVLDQVPQWFEEWEQTLSRFRLDSEVSMLNAGAGPEHNVSTTLWAVLAAGLVAEELTDGLVNPLVLEALVMAGYDRTFDLLETDSAAHAQFHAQAGTAEAVVAQALPSLNSIVLDASTRTLSIPSGMGLDFGGVAKGWAAHQAMERLNAIGPALVSAGGDVAVSRPRLNGEPWRVGVEDPAQRDRHLEMIYIERGGVATSGKDHRNWQRGGAFMHHIIDPRTLEPAQTDIMAATVVASSVMRAEALAKAVLIAGSEAGLEMLETIPDAEAVLVLDDRRLLYSSNIGEYL